MEHFYQTIGEPWFTSMDLYARMVAYFPDGAHFIEVGSWRGRSACFMAVEIINAQKTIKFDCVDTWLGSKEHLDSESPYFVKELLHVPDYLYNEFLKNTLPVSHIIRPIRETSECAATRYFDRSLDFVFIDAAHDYDSVKADIQSWLPKVKRGGVLAGDDYRSGWSGVDDAIDEMIEARVFDTANFTVMGEAWVYCK